MIRPDGYGHLAHCSIGFRVNVHGASDQSYEKSSKWLIQHHEDSMLRLARVKNIRAWHGLPVGRGEQQTAQLAIGAPRAPNAARNLPRREVVRGQASSALPARLTK
jgi:hypothetical protein